MLGSNFYLNPVVKIRLFSTTGKRSRKKITDKKYEKRIIIYDDFSVVFGRGG